MIINILLIVPIFVFIIGFGLTIYNANHQLPKELFKDTRKSYIERALIYQFGGAIIYYACLITIKFLW